MQNKRKQIECNQKIVCLYIYMLFKSRILNFFIILCPLLSVIMSHSTFYCCNASYTVISTSQYNFNKKGRVLSKRFINYIMIFVCIIYFIM